jgi:hypothetical protein
MSKSKTMPPPAVNPYDTKANLPTTAKTKAPPSQAHQGKSDGLIDMAATPHVDCTEIGGRTAQF